MSQRDADHLETQNDQRLDELHSKIRTLRGVCLTTRVAAFYSRQAYIQLQVTTDIYEDVERQNLTLDETVTLRCSANIG